jgi:hypothetical protein
MDIITTGQIKTSQERLK